MSDRNLRLQVVLGAVDKLTRPFKQAQQGTKSLASEIQKTRNQLKKLDAAGSDLQRFTKLSQSLKETSSALEKAKISAQSMSQEYSALTNPTKQQTAAFEKQQRAVSKLEDKFKTETRQLSATRAELYRMGISANGGTTETERLRQETTRYNQQLTEQQRKLKLVGERESKLNAIRRQHSKSLEMRNQLAGAGVSMIAQGGVALMGVRKAVDEASTYDMELASFKALGVGDSTLQQATKFAQGMDVIGNSAADNLKTLKEAHSVLRDFHEAKMVAPELARLQFATQFLSAHGVNDEAAQKMRDQSPSVLKIAELRNEINNPEDFKKSLNMSAQAMAASGGMVLPDDYMEMMKTGGIAAKQMSDKAFYFSMSHIIQQIGGDRTGSSLASAYQNLMMGRTTQGAAEELMKLGLLKKDAVQYGKTGHIKKVTPDALINGKEYTQDPFNYLLNEIVPRIKKASPNLDEHGMETAIAKLFSNRRGADLFVTMYREQANIKKQIAAGQSAFNVDQLVAEGKGTAQGQRLALQARQRDLYLQMGRDILPLYVTALEKVASVMHRVTIFMQQHPKLAKAIALSAAGFGVVATALGGIALAVTSILGPMALLRFILLSSGIKWAGGFSLLARVANIAKAAIGSLGTAVMWLGRLMFTTPVGLIIAAITAIAVGAYYVWQNWGTLGPKFHALWDSIANALSSRWEAIKQGFSQLWSAIVTEIAALPQQFASFGGALIDSLLDGINSKWEALKTKLSSLSDYLPDWLTGKGSAPTLPKAPNVASTDKQGKAVLPAGGFPPMGYAGMYDTGGKIGRGQFGIVGENGPEIVNGPANITSRRKTAALASVVAGFMGVTLPQADVQATPLITATPNSTSTVTRTPSQPSVITHRYDINAPITIYAQPGQSASDIASEVARQLDARERKAQAKARSNFSDQGGIDL
ncbi:hypothetical protein HGT71_14235 [Rosenbergiella epipactidis]|uniref:phage tail tape measure protein n=1 Tax=Rosenbergiella epipactidis TaxID=1544694 RepID=UPI001BD970E6|nr:hypothetical protein [Rosenbergiella epipactidis]MBT0719404.1 hypothetical protein [Rosenbergiella epipactidis]